MFELRHGFKRGPWLAEACEQSFLPKLGGLGFVVVSTHRNWDGEEMVLSNNLCDITLGYALARLVVGLFRPGEEPVAARSAGFIRIVLRERGEKAARNLAAPVHRSQLTQKLEEIAHLLLTDFEGVLHGDYSEADPGNERQIWWDLQDKDPLY